MSRNDLRSQSLDLLRFPLAVVVLTIHTFSVDGFTFRGTEYTFENMPVLMEVNHFIDGFLRGQSVPVYFFISGFVFFLGIELTKEKYLQKLKNRTKTLLVPYLLWNVLAVLLVLARFLPFLSGLFPNIHEVALRFSFMNVLNTFWNGREGIFTPVGEVTNNSMYPQDIPLWFVRDLMIVVLCAPLIYWVLRRVRAHLVCLLGVAWFALGDCDLGHAYQLLTAFFFFSWGAYMSIGRKDMLVEFGRFFRSSAWLYPLLGVLYVVAVHLFPEACGVIKRLNVFVGLFFAYNLSALLLSRGICKVSPFLAASSFFIYVSHTLINGDVLKCFFYLFHPVSDIGMLSVYLLTVLFTTLFLLLLFYLLQRHLPTVLRVLTGRK